MQYWKSDYYDLFQIIISVNISAKTFIIIKESILEMTKPRERVYIYI